MDRTWGGAPGLSGGGLVGLGSEPGAEESRDPQVWAEASSGHDSSRPGSHGFPSLVGARVALPALPLDLSFLLSSPGAGQSSV